MTERLWRIEDHLCRDCGGRVLTCVKGTGPSPGGSPMVKCADCGKQDWGQPDKICWCGFSHRLQHHLQTHVCLPFSIIEKLPSMREAFLSHGCDPARGEVGVVLVKQLTKARKQQESMNGD